MKTKIKKADEVIDELEESLGKDVDAAGELRDKVAKEIEKGPTFDEKEDKAVSTGDLVGRRARFNGDEDDMLGTITSQNGDEVVITDDKTPAGIWDSKIGEFVLLPPEAAPKPTAAEPEDRAPAGVPTEPAAEPVKGKKGGKKAAAPIAEAPAAEKPKSSSKTPTELVWDPPRAVKIADVKIPKKKVRELDKESEKYKARLVDLKENGQEEAIVLTSWEDMTLVDGLIRLSCLEELGKKMVFARVRAKPIETDGQRLYHGLRMNEQRTGMHWLEVALVFAQLVADGEFKVGQLAKEFGYAGSDVSRMIAAVQLPKPLLKVAEETRDDGELKYPQTVFLELAGQPEKARAKVAELMKAGTPVTVTDVREIGKEARADKAAAGEEVSNRGGARDTTPAATREKTPTYRALSVKELGEYLGCRVFGNRIELTVVIPHENKTFRNFDLIKAVKDVVNESFSNDKVAIRSNDDLIKALNEARAAIA